MGVGMEGGLWSEKEPVTDRRKTWWTLERRDEKRIEHGTDQCQKVGFNKNFGSDKLTLQSEQ